MIVFLRQGTLSAQRLDLERGELTGDPIPLADSVTSNGAGYGAFSVSTEGLVAYRAGGGAPRQLKWYDRTGKVLGVAGGVDSAVLLYPELSPDGRRLALQRTDQNNTDVWLMDLVRGGLTRFTVDPTTDGAQLWSGDGTKILFASTRKGALNLYLRPSNLENAEELLMETPNNKYPHDWSRDGRFILYGESVPNMGRDLWALPMTDKDRKPSWLSTRRPKS
jgi:dipeptidyl aminopeptidase/acylaminoacyl peptidase